MKNLGKKLKKTNKALRCIFFIILFIFAVSGSFMIQGLLRLTGIENLIRTIVITALAVILILYLVGGLVLLILKKHAFLITFMVFIFILSCINFTGFYLVNKGFSFLNRLNISMVKYTTNLVTLADTEKDNVVKVGMIDTDTDIEGYVLPKEYLDKNNLTYEIVEYEDYYFLLADLYNKQVDAIFISGNYADIYSNTEEYANIDDETKVIATYTKEMEKEDLNEATNKSVTEPISLLLIGIDSKYDGLEGHSAFNGDTLMIVTFNPKTLTATMFSIPRDTFVPITCLNNRKYKINAAAAYGTNCMLNTIEQFIGINIDYTVKINFKGVVSLVDVLGGIEVDVPVPDYPKSYCTDNSDRKKSGTVCLTPGKQTLDGEHALALARNRKAFALVDFKRVQNQQLVVEAIAKKLKTLRNVNDFMKVLDTVSKNIDTNMSTKEMLNFYNVGKTILEKSNFNEDEFFNIQKTYLSGYGLTIAGHGYTYQHYEESLKAITDAMQINLELKKPEIIKTFSFSANTQYEITTIGKNMTGTQSEETLPNFVGQSYQHLLNWNSSRNLTINKIDKESNTCIQNEILQQSLRKGYLVSNIRSLTVTVCKNITGGGGSTTTTTTTTHPAELPTEITP